MRAISPAFFSLFLAFSLAHGESNISDSVLQERIDKRLADWCKPADGIAADCFDLEETTCRKSVRKITPACANEAEAAYARAGGSSYGRDVAYSKFNYCMAMSFAARHRSQRKLNENRCALLDVSNGLLSDLADINVSTSDSSRLLMTLAQMSNSNMVIAHTARPLPAKLSVRSKPVADMLRSLVKQGNNSLFMEDDAYVVTDNCRLNAAPQLKLAYASNEDDEKLTLTLNFQRASLATIFEVLSQFSGKQFRVPASFSDTYVSVVVRNVPYKHAATLLAKAAGLNIAEQNGGFDVTIHPATNQCTSNLGKKNPEDTCRYGPQTNLGRPREPLECYALDEIKPAGYVKWTDSARTMGFVEAPNGNLYRVAVETRLGRSLGIIDKIDRDGITLREFDQSGQSSSKYLTFPKAD